MKKLLNDFLDRYFHDEESIILVILLMSALVERFLAEPLPQVPVPATVATTVDSTTLAVISAAIHTHRSRSSNHE